MPAPAPTTVTTTPLPLSCLPGSVNVRTCMDFAAMWKAHPLNWSPPEGHPFRNKLYDPVNGVVDKTTWLYENECAIKMSIALQAGGLEMTSFKKATVTSTTIVTKQRVRAAIRAEDLGDWLDLALGKAERITLADVPKLKGRTGIVFFKDFWQRTLPSGNLEKYENRSGDHIDLWNGDHIPNWMSVTDPAYGTGANGDWSHYFNAAKGLRFWEIK